MTSIVLNKMYYITNIVFCANVVVMKVFISHLCILIIITQDAKCKKPVEIVSRGQSKRGEKSCGYIKDLTLVVSLM